MNEREQTDVEYFSAITKAPRVEVLLDRYQRCYPVIGKSSQARYFEEVHQALAPLARELERENGELRAEIDRLNKTIRDQFAARRTTPDREAWISIEDRLPEEGQDVAFVVKAAKGSIQDYLNGRVLGGGFMIVGGHPTFTVPGVGFNASHWMPLPTAPGQTPTPSPRDTLIEEIAEMVDHMGEGRRLEEYVGAIREMKGGKS